MRLSRPFLSSLLLLLVISPVAVAEEGFVSLFDGKSLDGWSIKGGAATYAIEEDAIVGTSVLDTSNTFLCTDKHYSDFILELDVRVDSKLNSGIQIRSNSYDEPKVYETTNRQGTPRTITVRAKQVHGYQVEIDPSERAWSGGIYDEGRRGWLFDLKGDEHEAARKAFKVDGWNHYRIEARGPSIKTWINGVPASDLTDDLTPSGFIALQVHGIGNDKNKAGTQVRWRNIKIQDLSETKADAPTKVLYKGKEGPGKGKTVVLISGDEEYRSEEALPQLGKILAERHGFDCHVLFPIDPQTGYINPNYQNNIPGLEALESADLLVILTRFRALPDEQMKHIDNYLKSGKPVMGLRTSTHAFEFPKDSPWAHYSNSAPAAQEGWSEGFGRTILGEKWISHHGQHRHQSTRGFLTEEGKEHPVTRGVEDGSVWGATDVYGVRLPLPGDSQPLMLGQVVNRAIEYDANDLTFGMRETDTEAAGEKQNDPMMPIVWTKSYQIPGGEKGEVLTSTIASSTDFLDEDLRRLLVNGVYYLTGLAEQIPEQGTDAQIVGEYEPTTFEFRKVEYWNDRKMSPAEFELK